MGSKNPNECNQQSKTRIVVQFCSHSTKVNTEIKLIWKKLLILLQCYVHMIKINQLQKINNMSNYRNKIIAEKAAQELELSRQLEREIAIQNNIDRKRLLDRSTERLLTQTNLNVIQNQVKKSQLERRLVMERLGSNLKRSRLENQIKAEEQINRSIKYQYELKRVNAEERYLNLERQRQINQENQLRRQEIQAQRIRFQAARQQEAQRMRLQAARQQGQLERIARQELRMNQILNNRRIVEVQKTIIDQQLERSRIGEQIRRSRLVNQLRKKEEFDHIARVQSIKYQQSLEIDRLAQLERVAQEAQIRRLEYENGLRRSRLENQYVEERRSLQRLNEHQRLERIKQLENQSAERLRRINNETNNIGRDTRLAANLSKVVSRPRAESRNKGIDIAAQIAKSRLESEMEMTRLTKK